MESPSIRSPLVEGMVRSPRRRRISFWLAARTIVLSILPVWVSLLANILATTVTIYFLSRTSPDPTLIAGIGLAITLNNCILRTFIVGYNVGMITLSSQAAGSGEVDKAAQVLNRTLVSGTLFFVLMAGIMFFIQELIYWIGIEPAVADVAVLYSRITLAAFLIWMYYDSFRQYLNSQGMFYIHFPVTIVTLMVNVMACYILIDMNDLGIVGAALSINAQMIANFVIILAIALIYTPARQRLRGFTRESFSGLFEIARKGLPSFLMLFLDLLSLEIVTILSNYISTEHLAANTALINLFYISVLFSYGVQGTAGPLIGQAMGQSHIEKAKKYGKAAWMVGMIYAIIFCILFLCLPRQIASIYTTDDRVIDIMQKSSPYVAACILLDHSQLSLSANVVGLGKQEKVSKYNILLYLFLGVPLGVLITFYFKVYEGGFWIGLAVAFLTINILYYAIVRFSDYEKIAQEINDRFQYEMMKDEEAGYNSEEEEDEQEGFQFKKMGSGIQTPQSSS